MLPTFPSTRSRTISLASINAFAAFGLCDNELQHNYSSDKIWPYPPSLKSHVSILNIEPSLCTVSESSSPNTFLSNIRFLNLQHYMFEPYPEIEFGPTQDVCCHDQCCNIRVRVSKNALGTMSRESALYICQRDNECLKSSLIVRFQDEKQLTFLLGFSPSSDKLGDCSGHVEAGIHPERRAFRGVAFGSMQWILASRLSTLG